MDISARPCRRAERRRYSVPLGGHLLRSCDYDGQAGDDRAPDELRFRRQYRDVMVAHEYVSKCARRTLLVSVDRCEPSLNHPAILPWLEVKA